MARRTGRRCSRALSPACRRATRNFSVPCLRSGRPDVHLAVYLPLLIPVIAGLAARPVAERLPPRPATWLLAGSALALAAASSVVLGLLALTAVVRVPFVAGLGHMSARAISQADPASAPVAIIATAFLAYVA